MELLQFTTEKFEQQLFFLLTEHKTDNIVFVLNFVDFMI